MRRSMVFLLALLLLAGVLSGCGGRDPAPAEDPPPEEALPDDTAVPQPETLEAFLANLKGEDIAHVSWFMHQESQPSNEEIALLLNAAAAHTVEHGEMTGNGSETDVIWSLDIYIGDPNAGGWSSDDALHLFANQEENIVEVFGGSNLPDGTLWVEDAPLYQLVRTVNDTPDSEIDQAAYEVYRTEVDGYLADMPAYYSGIGADVHRELTGFTLAERNERLDAEVYRIACVCIVDPPETGKVMQLLAGGAYIDSQMRVHEDGNGVNNLLVAVDGQPIGFTGWENLEYGSLDFFETREALIEAVRSEKTWY